MARLSEPPVDSIDSLTRRFVRQNRDLTRVNANQSVKIRALENQISALLAENLSLRGTVIELRGELDTTRSTNVVKNVTAIQKQLETKLQELSGLVFELGSVEKKSKRRKSQLPPLGESQKAQSARDRIFLEERNVAREGQLPTIMEDKSYPRKTLDSSEIAEIVAQELNDSPDIGPPPTTFFDREETTSTDPVQPSNNNGKAQDEGDTALFMSANFETRRRRRETFVHSDDRTESTISQNNIPPQSSESISSRPMRAGAKRKLDTQDRPAASTAAPFDFVRKRRPQEDQETRPGDATGSTGNLDLAPVSLRPPIEEQSLASPKRKALLSKSVNMSPQKPATEIAKDQKPPSKPDFNHSHKNESEFTDHTIPLPSPPTTTISTVEIKLEPTTPGPLSILSPTSTQPSELSSASTTSRPASPRPGAEHLASGTGRPSRRARAQVSYAEPNLISKMRRPGKEMADAVAPEREKTRRESGVGDGVSVIDLEGGEKVQQSEPPPGSAGVGTVMLQKVKAENAEWRPSSAVTTQQSPTTRSSEQKSPLGNKQAPSRPSTTSRPINPTTTSRDRRRTTFQTIDTAIDHPNSQHTTKTNSTIAVAAAAADISPDVTLQSAMQNLDIYDVPDTTTTTAQANSNANPARPRLTSSLTSSALSTTSTATTASTTRPLSHLSRSNSTSALPPRSRPSSSTSSTTTTSSGDAKPTNRRVSLSANANAHRSADALARTSALQRGVKTAVAEPVGHLLGLDGTMDRERMEADTGAVGVSVGGSGRVERMANRRRSMML